MSLPLLEALEEHTCLFLEPPNIQVRAWHLHPFRRGSLGKNVKSCILLLGWEGATEAPTSHRRPGLGVFNCSEPTCKKGVMIQELWSLALRLKGNPGCPACGQSSALHVEWVASLPLAGTDSVQLSVTHAAAAAGLVLPALVAARRSSDVRSTPLAGRPPSQALSKQAALRGDACHCGQPPPGGACSLTRRRRRQAPRPLPRAGNRC